MSKRKDVIRQGDRVRIVVPTFVLRVGYPKQVKDYLDDVERLVGQELYALLHGLTVHGTLPNMNGKGVTKLKHDLAYIRAKSDGFGGRERKLHTVDKPELEGEYATVLHVRTVMTGMYSPASGGYSSWGSYDDSYEPPTLDAATPHRLATLELDRPGVAMASMIREMWTPVASVKNLEKLS